LPPPLPSSIAVIFNLVRKGAQKPEHHFEVSFAVLGQHMLDPPRMRGIDGLDPLDRRGVRLQQPAAPIAAVLLTVQQLPVGELVDDRAH